MNFKNNHQQSAWNHKIAPRESAWLRLDTKLERHRSSRTINKYKYISLAAVLIAVFGVISVFYIQSDALINRNESAQAYRVDSFDPNEIKEIGIYDVSQLQSLKVAYSKHTEKEKI